jgi:hypothetical protein
MVKELHAVVSGVLHVVKHGWYNFFAILFALALVLALIWLPNLAFLGYLMTSPAFTLLEKTAFILQSFRMLAINFSTLSLVFMFTSVALVSLNTVLLVYYIKRRLALSHEAGVGVLGMVGGLVGIGCASCGSIILTYFLGIGFATRLFGALPFRGYELQVVSIIFPLASLWLVARKIEKPLVCTNYERRTTDKKTTEAA